MDTTQNMEDPIYLIIEPPSSISNQRDEFFERQMSLEGETNVVEEGEWSPGPPESKNIIADSFSEMVTDHPVERKIPLVVLDSANIGWCFGEGAFSARGLQLAVEYFQRQKVEIKAFLPAYYVQQKPSDGSRQNSVMETDEISYLQTLIRQKILALVPSGESDDAYIIQYARECSGFIITNDMFRDHMNSLSENSMKLSLQLWLAENRVGFTFAENHFLINPNSLLSSRLQQLEDENTPNIHERRLSHSQSQSNFFVQPANKAILSITKTISEYHRLHRYNDVKVLILMKVRLLLDIERFQECYEEIQSILLYLDPQCMESKQILSILQEKTRSSMQHTSSRDEESVRERPQVPSAVSHHQHHHHQNQFQQQQNQPFANRGEQMSLPSPSSLTSAMYRGEEEKNRFDPRTPSDTVPPSFRHVSESRLQRSAAVAAAAPPPPSHPGNQFESMQQQSTVRDARHQMLLDNFVPGPFAGQESGPRHTFQQQQRQQVQQEQQLQHQQMRQRQQMQHFRSAQPSQDLSSFSSSPHQQQHHHHQQQQQQQQQNLFPSSISPSNRQMNSFRQDNSNTFKSRSPRQQSGQGHQFQQFQQSQLERATQQFSLQQQQQQQQQQREGPSMHHPQNPDSYAAYQLQQQQQFAEFASNRQAPNDPVNVAMLMQQQRERERAAQQFSEMNQVAEEHNGPAPDSYEAWLARK